MTLKERIKSDIKEAMRAKETARRDTLRNISAAIKQIEVDERRDLSDGDVENILLKYAKQREDALEQFEKAGREDLVEKEKAELDLVRSYLPEPMTEEELTETLKSIVADSGADSMKDMGMVMQLARKEIGSRADGSRISQIIKELLTK